MKLTFVSKTDGEEQIIVNLDEVKLIHENGLNRG